MEGEGLGEGEGSGGMCRTVEGREGETLERQERGGRMEWCAGRTFSTGGSLAGGDRGALLVYTPVNNNSCRAASRENKERRRRMLSVRTKTSLPCPSNTLQPPLSSHYPPPASE